MASINSDDILLHAGNDAAGPRPARSRIAAYVPIAIALVGVAAILLGRVTVREVSANDMPAGFDMTATGSIEAPAPMKADGSPGAR